MFENLEQIKKAIEVERKYQYINIRGKSCEFSKFMIGELRKIYKKDKNQKWKILEELFELYLTDSMPQRKRTIERFVKVVSMALQAEKQEAQESSLADRNPEQVDVSCIKGVGAKVGAALNKLGIFSALDLLFYFPKRHIDYSTRTLIKHLKVDETTTVFAKIKSVSSFVTKNKLSVLKVTIADESGSIDLSFFYAKANRVMLERYKSMFPNYASIMVSGKVKFNSFDGRLTFDKPQYSILSGDFSEGETSNLNLGRIVPIYPLNDLINIKTLRKTIYQTISIYKNKIKTIVPKEIREKYDMLEKSEAVFQMHFPNSMEMLEKARFSLVFEELFLIQLRLAILREENRHNSNSIPLKIKEKGLVNKFIKSLPFELTNAQKRAVDDILRDLNSKGGMQRLLQGDVGSGKTVVATIMLLAAVENGYQAALMAPTEILAQQHFNNLTSWLTPMGISVGLFLGSNKKKLRDTLKIDLQNGQMKIAVGTHALIQDDVKFDNLGAVIVDEQHRFGVKQRNILKNKSKLPQLLTMTATPIPRTLALTMHGDLNLTIIDELPKGRKPIKTSLVRGSSRASVHKLIKAEVEKGRQAYVVYPLIDESETLSAKAATKEAEYLQEAVFPDLKIGLLHGKLKNQEKEQVMADFKAKKYDILVSTTVVEVGVDVPNATVMVIENAERFGLSQLHQLRGRVGRSDLQSYCVLVTATKSQETLTRLDIMTQTNDGFVIAEQDLQLRGPGEFLGTRQSGLPDLLVADIVRDTKILDMARKEAFEYVKNNGLDKISDLKESVSIKYNLNFDLLNSG